MQSTIWLKFGAIIRDSKENLSIKFGVHLINIHRDEVLRIKLNQNSVMPTGQPVGGKVENPYITMFNIRGVHFGG